MQQYKVNREEAAKFAQIWSKGGIAVPMQDIHIDFAADFANVVLRNFVQMCKQQVQQAAQAPRGQEAVQEPASSSKLVLAAG